jgi:septum formation protein
MSAKVPSESAALHSFGTIVLASASPRRRAILTEMGVAFTVDAPIGPEPQPEAFPTVEQFVTYAAHRKALEVADRRTDSWVLAADTVAEVDGEVLGKPADRSDAERILRRLLGRRHRTWTGLCLLRVSDRLALVLAQSSGVTFRDVSEQRLRAYLDGDGWQGKAGAYGIQHEDDPFVERLEGSFTNVMGLPVEGATTLFAAAERLGGIACTQGLA